MNNPADITLVYKNEGGRIFEQSLADVVEVGNLIDADTGEDLELVGWKFTEGDSFIVVDGGIVQNEVGIPVFDMDVLDADIVEDQAQSYVSEVQDLYDRISEHDEAKVECADYLQTASDLIRSYGDPEDVDHIQELEAARLGGEDPRPDHQ